MKYYIYYKGGKIFYSDTGASSGTPLVLLHGYLESSEIWSGFTKRLSSDFRVISIDLPGHGSSSIYSECHTMEFMAEAVNEVLAGLDVSKAFITGHSLGGYVVLAFLELFPQKLKGYCLFHSHPYADTPEAVHKREREIEIVRSGKKYLMYPDNVSMMFASDNLTKFQEALNVSKEIASRTSDEGIISVLKGMMARPSRVGVLEEGSVPFLWILGRHDNYIPHDSVLSRTQLPSSARVVILEKSGHMGFVEEESLSAMIISDFMKELNRHH